MVTRCPSNLIEFYVMFLAGLLRFPWGGGGGGGGSGMGGQEVRVHPMVAVGSVYRIFFCIEVSNLLLLLTNASPVQRYRRVFFVINEVVE